MALGLAVFLAMTAAAATAMVLAAYQSRAVHDAARFPVMTDQKTNGALRWDPGFDTLQDHLQHSVISIVPLRSDAPLPPGLARWPNPGEAFLSPQLLADGQGEEVGTRYGQLAGVIDSSGLSAADERLAYVRPVTDQVRDSALYVTQFGLPPGPAWEATGRAFFGESLQINDLRAMLSIAGAFLIVPAMLSLVVASGVGREPRDRRDVVLASMGAPPWTRRVGRFGDIAAPSAVGLALAIAVLGAASLTSWRIPIVGYMVTPDLARGSFRWLATAMFLAAFGCLVLLTRATRMSRTSSRPQVKSTRLPVALILLTPVALFATVNAPMWVDPTQGPAWGWTYKTLVLIAVLTLPLSCAAAVGAASERLRDCDMGRLTGAIRPAAAIAAARPWRVSRTIAGIAALVILAIQAQMWASQSSANALQAVQEQTVLANKVALINLPTGAATTEFVGSLARELGVLAVDPAADGASSEVRGDCKSLRAAELPCSSGTVDATALSRKARIILGNTSPSPTIRIVAGQAATRASPANASLVLFSHSGAIDLPRLKAMAYSGLPQGITVDLVGDTWLVGSASRAFEGQWIVLFGLAASILLACTLLLDAVGHYLTEGRALRSIAAIAGGRRALDGILAWSILAPFAVGALVAAVVGVMLARPITAVQTTDVLKPLSWAGAPIIAFTAGCVAFALASALWRGVWDGRSQ